MRKKNQALPILKAWKERLKNNTTGRREKNTLKTPQLNEKGKIIK